MVFFDTSLLKAGVENRMIVDHSFKLGYLFSITIQDLRQILTTINSGSVEHIKPTLIEDLATRFTYIEKHFKKLYFYNAISEDDLNYIVIFLNESKKLLEDSVNELKNSGKLNQEKVALLKKLLKDMLDY